MLRISRDRNLLGGDSVANNNVLLRNAFILARNKVRSSPSEFADGGKVHANGFVFVYHKNLQRQSKDGKLSFFHSFSYYDIEKDFINYDFTLLDKFEKYIFNEIEEYTFLIMEAIIKRWPKKKIYCLDKLTNRIFSGEQVTYVASIDDCNLIEGNKCYINSENYNAPYGRMDSYNSLNVIHSLLWACNIEHLGEKNKAKTIFLIDYPVWTAGLVDIIKFTAAWIMVARKRSWIPVVCLNKKPNQYLLSETDNMWEYFFEPVSRISYDEAMSSYRVIRASKNYMNLWDDICNPYQREAMHEFWLSVNGKDNGIVHSVFHLNYATRNKIEQNIPSEIKNKSQNILGVICRGTDYSPEALKKIGNNNIKNVGVENMIVMTELYCAKYGCDYVFLATEDEEYLNRYKEKFGDKLLYIQQKRVRYNYLINNYKSLSALLDLENGKAFGETYLSLLFCLAGCRKVISSMQCGAVWGVGLLANSSFEKPEIIKYDSLINIDEDIKSKLVSVKEKMLQRPLIKYSVHWSRLGWIKNQYEDVAVKVTDYTIEAVRLNFDDNFCDTVYSTLSNEGWSDIVKNGDVSGSTGKSKPLFGIRINLEKQNEYNVLYRAYFADTGWSEWKCNGDKLTNGKSPMLGLEVKLNNR